MTTKNPNVFKALFEVFFPRFCPGCFGVLQHFEAPLCWKCSLQLPRTHFHQVPKNTMWEQLNRKIKISHATALCFFHPDSLLQNCIYALKYNGQVHLGTYFGELLGETIKNSAFGNCTAIIPVPLHPKREKQRGYNQIHSFATALGTALKIPVRKHVIERTENTPSLALGAFKNRWALMASAFRVCSQKNIANQHWLLVDDVLTTGATITACATLLLSFPNSKVSIATIAYRMS